MLCTYDQTTDKYSLSRSIANVTQTGGPLLVNHLTGLPSFTISLLILSPGTSLPSQKTQPQLSKLQGYFFTSLSDQQASKGSAQIIQPIFPTSRLVIASLVS
jgi:hypothetical protein